MASSRFVSIVFPVEKMNGVEFIQNVHVRILGDKRDLRIHDDIGVEDMTIMDLFRMVKESPEVD